MAEKLTIRPFLPRDVVRLDLQPSQHVTLGLLKPVHSIADGRTLEASGPAWTAIARSVAGPSNPTGADRVLCCYGFAFQFAATATFGGHALAWAMLGRNLGRHHLAISRFARETLATSPIARIEAIVRDDVPAECRWAEAVGFTLAAVLRSWGPEGATHRLYERVKPAASAPGLVFGGALAAAA